MPGRSDLLVVVPAWNEREALPETLAEVAARVPGADVLVVDDGSSDGTGAVARAHGATVLTLPYNLGVGGAMRAGYRYGAERGYAVVVQVDADGQHDPADLPRLVEALAGADVVVGARFAGAGPDGARGPRRWAMRLLAVTVSAVAGTRLTDTTSGFRATGPHATAFFSRHYPAEYLGDTVESLVLASRAGLVLRQVPVQMRPRRRGHPEPGGAGRRPCTCSGPASRCSSPCSAARRSAPLAQIPRRGRHRGRAVTPTCCPSSGPCCRSPSSWRCCGAAGCARSTRCCGSASGWGCSSSASRRGCCRWRRSCWASTLPVEPAVLRHRLVLLLISLQQAPEISRLEEETGRCPRRWPS